jgi:hypothetical protein
MIHNFAFVVEGKLAGCAHPGWGDQLRTALAELSSRHGISAVVTLDTEPLPKDLLAEYGMKGHHTIVRDFGVPSLESATQAVDSSGAKSTPAVASSSIARRAMAERARSWPAAWWPTA